MPNELKNARTKNVDRKIASVRKVANAHEPLSFSSIISVTKRSAGFQRGSRY
jgi:hypothetical protein